MSLYLSNISLYSNCFIRIRYLRSSYRDDNVIILCDVTIKISKILWNDCMLEVAFILAILFIFNKVFKLLFCPRQINVQL